MTDYWIEREPPVGRLSDHGAGRRPRRDRQWRRLDRLGRRFRQAPCRSALGRRMPGPAAYGRGGTHATTTDANLALGRINRDFFCGGAVEADMEAVDGALGRVASKLGVSPIEAARGIVRIANSNMVNALKLVSLNRGYRSARFRAGRVRRGRRRCTASALGQSSVSRRWSSRAARRFFRLGHDDVGSAARLFRHPA